MSPHLTVPTIHYIRQSLGLATGEGEMVEGGSGHGIRDALAIEG